MIFTPRSVSTCPSPDVAGRSCFVDGCYLATALATVTDQAHTSPLSQQNDFIGRHTRIYSPLIKKKKTHITQNKIMKTMLDHVTLQLRAFMHM